MTREEYLAKRTNLANEAEQLINDGKVEDADAKMKDIEALDTQFDSEATAMANLAALKGQVPNVNADLGNTVTVEPVSAKGGEKINMNDNAATTQQKQDYTSESYMKAWAKSMMGQDMTDAENQLFKNVNADFRNSMNNSGITTTTASQVVPKTVADGIWKEIGEKYPLWDDVTKTYVNGNLSIIKGDTSSDAAWYDEDTNTADGSETFGTLELTGCELSRSVTISWKLKEMSIEDFIPYIQSQLAEKMGKGLGYGVSHGKGKPGNSDTFKPEPLGIVTALNAEEDTPHVTTYTSGALTYDKTVEARSKVKSGYGVSIYANSKTIWTEIAKVKDTTGNPIFVADPMAGGVYKVLGSVVKEDDSMDDGEILFADAKQYRANVNKQMSVVTEDHAKARNTDYCSYAIVDGGLMTTNAFSLLKKA